MDNNLKRSIILEHYQNPKNRGLVNDNGYKHINMNNESCIDEIDLNIKIEDGIVKDIHFDGEACAISTSSTSIMINTLIGKTIDEALNIYNNFDAMIDEREYNKDVLEEAIVYDDICRQPNRKKCALLPWWGIKKALEEAKKQISKQQ